ncbi:hypothetical protein HPB51_021219 [Rhipicephalus microplus]|uniref:Transmembrane protein n=1 Tax=Rhipicephalus microplus TaxID=6941 RepID=A0A9J6F7J8_RHIMP|nr:hypothetical protein HPB51_021219 [Rhipicephalus microplus]
MSTEQAVSQQGRERRDGEHSSDNVTALEVDQDGGQSSAATTAQLSSSITVESEHCSPRHTDGEESELSLESLVRKPGASSSSGKRQEVAAVVSELPVPVRPRKPEPVGYRPLVQQFSPSKSHQEHRSFEPKPSFSPATAEHEWPGAWNSPLSPESPGTPPDMPVNYRMLWNGVASAGAEIPSASQPLTRTSRFDEHLPLGKPDLHEAREDLGKEPTIPPGLNALAVVQPGTQTSEDAHTNTFQQLRDLGSPRSLIPRSETPKRLDVWRGTPEVIRDASSSSLSCSISASEISSPQMGTALGSPRLRRFVSSSGRRVPWATLAVICLQLSAYWNRLHKDYPERCASVSTIMIENRWERVLFAAFQHGNVSILALNSICFFATGVLLEAGLGTVHFAALFAATAALVGVVNTFVLLLHYEYTRLSSLFTACSYTFAGVIVVLQQLTSTHFGRARIRYGRRKFRFPSRQFRVLQVVTLLTCAKVSNHLMVVGLLVGIFLAKTSPGNFITRIQKPRLRLHLYVVPNTPITYIFAVHVIAAFLYGPFPDDVTLADTGLSFRDPERRPLVLPLLYQPNIFMLVYVVCSLLDVGKELEQDFGHIGFLCLVWALLLTVHGLLDLLSVTIWRHLLELGENLPTPMLHSSLCTCDSVATLMAFKVIHHVRHPRCVYSMPSVAIRVPFWIGMLFELAVLSVSSHSVSYVIGPIAGVLLGIAVASTVLSDYVTNLTVRLAGLSDTLRRRAEAWSGNVPLVTKR